MMFKRFTRLLWASLGSLSGSWEVLGDPLGVRERLLGVLESPWWSLGVGLEVPGSLGGPRGSQGVLGEGPKGTENTKGSLGASGACPGGPLGRF